MAQYRAEDRVAHANEDKQKSDSDLSIVQVLAATGATTLGTILVKFLDLWGTVLGAATLSVCTSIGAVLIVRTVRRTGERIKTQIDMRSPAKADQAPTVGLNTGGGRPTRVTATAAVPDGDATRPLRRAEAADPEEAHVAKGASRKRTLIAVALSSVLVFGLTMGVLLLLGGVTGDPGRFVQQPAPAETTTILQTPETSTDPGEGASDPTRSDADEETEPSQTPSEQPGEDAPSETPTGEDPAEDPTSEPTDGIEAPEDGEGGSAESPVPGGEDQADEPEPSTAE